MNGCKTKGSELRIKNKKEREINKQFMRHGQESCIWKRS